MSFSETSDADATTRYCDPDIIPILPLRFALTGAALIGMLRSRATPSTPASLSNRPDHELVRIRRGYVYVFDGAVLQVFRFETRPDDENGSIYRSDTELGSYALPNMFTKYEWADGDPRGRWTQLNESYPYVFVPKDTPKAWIAYSEERWPYRFFFDVETNAAFRSKVMTEIDLSSRSGDFCAPITELTQHANVFADGNISIQDANNDYVLENAIRHTSVAVEPSSKVITCDNTREKGVLVALHDPVGEIQDLLGLMTVHATTLANFLAEHQYPLTIGRGVKNYVDADQVHTTRLRFWTGPLSERFEAEYARLLKQSDDIEAVQEGLAGHWMRMAEQSGFGSLGALMAACAEVAGRYSRAAQPEDHSEVVAYMNLILARVKSTTANSQKLTQAVAPLFSGVPSASSVPASAKVRDYFDNAAKLSKEVFASGGRIHNSFKPALNALFTVYATEIVSAGPNGTSQTSRLLQVMFTQSVSFRDRLDLTDAFTDMMGREGYANTRFPTGAMPLGTNISASSLMTEASEGRLGVIEFHAQVDIDVDTQYLQFARRANNFDLAANGFGLVCAGLALQQTIQKWHEPLRAASGIGAFSLNPITQLIAAFSEAYAGTYDLTRAMLNRGSAGATSTVLRNVFGNNASLANAATANGAAATGNVASKSLAVSAKVAGIVGIAMNGFLAYEGHRRGDSFMMVGNGLAALGGVVLLFVASGPLVLVAVAAIIIGVVISFWSYDDAQRWVKDGFWGTSGTYWGGARPAFPRQMDLAKSLADPAHGEHDRTSDFFERELEHYIDMNSDLTLVDAHSGDGKVEIVCGVIQTAADLSKIRVNAYVDWTFPYSNVTVETRLVFSAPGNVQVVLVKPSGLNENGPVEIEVEVDRTPNGQFEADITVQSDDLW